MSIKTRSTVYLLLVAVIWGLSYPIGRHALDTISPLALSGFRYMFGALSLLPFTWRRRYRHGTDTYLNDEHPLLWLKGGAIGGALLTVGGVIQLSGLAHTSAGLAGFLATLYLSLVPLMAFVVGHLPRPLVWAGLALGLTGLFFLAGGSAAGGFSQSEGLILVADVFWALQVLVTGKYALKVNPWYFSLTQAATCSFLSLTLALVFGGLPTWGEFVQTLPATAWGVLSVGVAYSLQTLAQRHTSATSVAMILPLQAVVGAAAGVFFLGEHLSPNMIWGAGFIMGGSLVAQFAKEPIRLDREHPSRPLQVVRLAVGALLGGGSLALFLWAVL